MDFWSRLLGGSRLSAAKSNNPEQRLQRFRRHFDQIRTTYEKTPLLQTDSVAAETVRSNLQRLTAILQDESRSPQPHSCLGYVDSAQIYVSIGRIGSLAQNEAVIRETVALFAVLVDCDEDDLFLSSRRFARALMTFVDHTSGRGNAFVGEDTESEIVEMLFGIAAKIRLEPDLLTVWFSTSSGLGARASLEEERNSPKKVKQNLFVGVTSKDDFPLCYQLIDHVHHEGRIGDFARTGLLYIFETASKSEELEKWLIESDIPTLMASGLGALYSQLSRKLSILHPAQDLPVVLQLSDYSSTSPPDEAESLFSESLQSHLATFLSYLTFWQDILEHCTSAEVKQTLLDHFQILFLQQLLYPSLLESSDADGGSSVAVLTYVRRILMEVDHPELIRLILQYLLALPQSASMEASVISLTNYAASKRKSLLLLTKSTDVEEANPDLFNLADLVQNSLRSNHSQTATAALKLMSVLLQKNHGLALNSIINTEPPLHEVTQRTHGALNAEIAAYLVVAESVGGDSGIDEAFEELLHDAQRHIERHCCSAPLLTLESLGIASQLQATVHAFDTQRHTPIHILQYGDPFFHQLVVLIRAFLTNDVEMNLALTEVVLTLASCPRLRLEEWLAINPPHYRYDERPVTQDGEASLSDVERMQLARREPHWSDAHASILLMVFKDVAMQIDSLHKQFPSFAQLVSARKQAFRLHDEISDAILSQPPPTQTSTPRQSEPPSSPAPVRALSNNAVPSRLFPGPATPVRSLSPRGRTPIRPDLGSIVHSSPSPNFRTSSSIASPVRSPALRPITDTRPMIVGQGPEDLLHDIIEGANSELLLKMVAFPLKEHDAGNNDDSARVCQVSLSHVLTNVVILQEFILELVAVMQVRASLFNEVIFA